MQHQLRGRLFPDLWHARNIIRRISHQSLQINKLLRRNLIPRFHIPGIVVLHFCPAAFGLGNPNLNMLRCNLQKVPVPGNKSHFHAFPFGPRRQRSEDIVGLQPGLLHNTDAHRLKHLFHDRNLLPQLLRHRFSCSFIFLINFMPKGRRMHIKSHGQIIRFFLFQNLEHNVQKTMNRIRMKSLAVGQIGHAVKSSVQDAVSIY